jgi:hypothetical protein
VVLHPLQHFELGRGGKRLTSRQQLVEDDAKREDVAARIGRFAGGLLGRHVGDRPDDHSRLRASRRGRPRRRFAVERLEQLRQAEISQLRVAVLRDKDVLRFDVAVDEAGRVRGRQPVGHADQKVDDLAPRARPGPRPCLERATVDKLCDEVLAAIHLADVVDRKDMRVIERRERMRFALEAGQPIGVRGEQRRQDFDRHLARQLRVAREIDLAHAAGAQDIDDFVRAEAIAAVQRTARQLVDDWRLGKAPRRFMREEQRLDIDEQRSIVSARLGKKRRPRGWALFERGLKHLLHIDHRPRSVAPEKW